MADVALRRRLVLAAAVLALVAAVGLLIPRPHAHATAGPALPPPGSATVLSVPSPTVSSTPLRAGAGCGFTLVAGRPVTAVADRPPVGHCTVLEIGDSLGDDVARGLDREVSPTSGLTFVRLDKPSTGLSHPSFYDWPAQLAAALPTYHPQLVLICLGGNDQQGIDTSSGPAQFGTPAWTTEYVARAHRLAAAATQVGAFVLWVGMPNTQQPRFSAGMATLDADVQAAIADLPAARFLPLRSLFATADGAYQASGVVDGKQVGLRQADGIHYAFAGESVAATYVLQQLSLLYDVRVEPVAPAVLTR